MRKRTVALLVIAAVLLALVGGIYWAGRHLFYEPTARGVDSVIGELGGTRVLGVFAHPDDEQTVNGLFWRAKRDDDAYTAMITATQGEAGEQSPPVGRQSDLGEIRRAEAL
ncbi:MAG TPA: PIG-L family deacetylase, partial [Agromyces sp.]|nr:PIG-L family deacetylase [Agromyces sp.]